MALITGSISSLINGVSQQSTEQRLSSQGSLQENALSSPSDGLGKRPNTEFVARLLDEQSEWPKVHFINRDEYEKYVVVFHGQRPRVYDLKGVRFPVYYGRTHFDYLACPMPAQDLKCLTIADETIVVNRTVTVGKDAATAPGYVRQALIWIRAGNYASNYGIHLNNHINRHILTSSTDVANIATDAIAGNLSDALQDIGSEWHVRQQDGNSVIWVYRADGDHFQIRGYDSQAGSSLTVVGDYVDRFSDLPPVAPNGMVVKVRGNPDSNADDYWVKFATDNSVNDVFPGQWVECPEPGSVLQLDPATMPHRLVRKQDGVAGSKTGTPYGIWFLFEPLPYSPRSVGNDDFSPFPSFVGQTINDAFLHRNRLGFCSGTNIVLSRSADFYSFFRSTLLDIQDDDPIDLTLAHPRVANFYHAVSFAGDLILFGDRMQAILRSGDTLTPKSASLTVSSEYESSPACKPVGSQNSIFVPFPNGTWGGVREYYIDGTTGQHTASSITGHVPRYFGNPVAIEASPAAFMMLLADSVSRNKLYVYQWYLNGQDKLQSSWSEWSFGDKRIYGFQFIGDYLYLVIERNCGHYLERVDLTRIADDGSAYRTQLDRRVDETQTTVHYDNAVGWSVITLPYRADFEPIVVTRNGGAIGEGIQFPIDHYLHACDPYRYHDPTTGPLPVDGDPTTPVVIGPDTPPDPIIEDPIPAPPGGSGGPTPPDPSDPGPPTGGPQPPVPVPSSCPSGLANDYTLSATFTATETGISQIVTFPLHRDAGDTNCGWGNNARPLPNGMLMYWTMELYTADVSNPVWRLYPWYGGTTLGVKSEGATPAGSYSLTMGDGSTYTIVGFTVA